MAQGSANKLTTAYFASKVYAVLAFVTYCLKIINCWSLPVLYSSHSHTLLFPGCNIQWYTVSLWWNTPRKSAAFFVGLEFGCIFLNIRHRPESLCLNCSIKFFVLLFHMKLKDFEMLLKDRFTSPIPNKI